MIRFQLGLIRTTWTRLSRGIPVPNRAGKTSVVAFKVEQELADLLDQLPNKSEFIRRAIHAQLGEACPLCRGSGAVTRQVHDVFEVFLRDWAMKQCDCGDIFPSPKSEESDSAKAETAAPIVADDQCPKCAIE